MTTPKESDLSKCPECGGEADNGHDRCMPPNVYLCTKCEKENLSGTPESVRGNAPKESRWRENTNLLKRYIRAAYPQGDKLIDLVDEIIAQVEATAIAATEARERAAHKETMGEMVREILAKGWKNHDGDGQGGFADTYTEVVDVEDIKAIARSRGVDDANQQV